jgi:hypothetical protein
LVRAELALEEDAVSAVRVIHGIEGRGVCLTNRP